VDLEAIPLELEEDGGKIEDDPQCEKYG